MIGQQIKTNRDVQLRRMQHRPKSDDQHRTPHHRMTAESVQRTQAPPPLLPRLTIKVSIGSVMTLMNQNSNQTMMHTMNRRRQQRQRQPHINQSPNPVVIMRPNRRVAKRKLKAANGHVHIHRAVHRPTLIRTQVQIPKRNANVNGSESIRSKRNRKNPRKRRRRRSKHRFLFRF